MASQASAAGPFLFLAPHLRGNRPTHAGVVRAFTVALLVVAVLLPSAVACGQETACDELLKAPVYILVIDHSGSMFQNRDMTDEQGEQIDRWEYMRNLAAKFVREAPLGTEIYLYVFEAYETSESSQERTLVVLEKPFTLTTEEARQRTAKYILSPRIEEDLPNPDPQVAGTALYDTLARAFDTADTASQRHPGSFIRVMAYTDITAYAGREDEHSELFDRTKLKEKFSRLVEERDNVFLFFTPMGAEQEPPFEHPHVAVGSPKHPVPVYVSPNRVLLRNPRELWDRDQQTEQQVELQVCLSQDHQEMLRDRSAVLAFDSDAVEAEPLGEVALERGALPVTLKVTNADQLSIDQKYAGRLKVIPPEIDRHDVQVTPPQGVEIEFLPPGPVPLRVVFPKAVEDGATAFALGTTIPFRAESLQTATIQWDFGDGTGAGLFVPHTYATEGPFEITVTASAPGFQDAKPVKLAVKIVDISVSIKQPPHWNFVGKEVTLEAQGRGPIQRYQWQIEGNSWAGSDPDGKMIAHRFDQPGKYAVDVKAIHAEYGAFPSENPIEVEVLPRPTLELTEPAQNSTYCYGQEMQIVAQVTKDLVEAVEFSIRPEDGKDLLAKEAGQAHVVTEEGKTVAKVTCRFKEAETLDQKVTVTAEAVLTEGCEVECPPGQLTLVPPPFKPKFDWPVAEQHGLGESIPFRCDCDTHDIQVTWDFGDGTPKVIGGVVNHTYVQHRGGGYPVTAKITRKSAPEPVTWTQRVVLAKRPVELGIEVEGKGEEGEGLRFSVGEVISLKKHVRGDAGTTRWLADGEPLPPGQETVTFDEPGEHTVALEAWPAIEGKDGVGAAPHSSTKHLRISPPPLHWLFFGVLVVAVLSLAVLLHRFTRNEPRGWSIGIAPKEDKFGPLETKVKPFWSRRAKKAVIPMPAVVGNVAQIMRSEYWTGGAGSRMYLILRRLKRRKAVRSSLVFSDEKNPNVTFELTGNNPDKRVYELLDARAPDKEPLRQVFLQLYETDKAPVADYVMLTVSFLALLAAVLMAAHFAYFR